MHLRPDGIQTASHSPRLLAAFVALAVPLSSGCASAPTCPVCPTVEASDSGPAKPADRPAAPVGPLILEGTPEIPSELKADLLRYLEARSANLAAVSDDGKSMLVSTQLGASAQIYRVDAALGQRTQVTFEAEPVRTAAFVPNALGAFVYVRDIGGNEQFQIYRADRGVLPVLLTDGKSRHGDFVFSRDGSRFIYTSNARNGRDMDLWISDGKSHASASLLVETKGLWTPFDISKDGKTLLVQEFVSIAEQRLHLVDIETRTTTQITPTGFAWREAFFDASGKRLFVTTDRPATKGGGAGEFVELQVMDLTTRETTSLSRAIPWNVESTSLSADGKTIAVAMNEDGYGTLRLFDTTTLKELARPQIPVGIVGKVAFARKAPVLGFSFGGPTVNGDAYVYDLRTKKVARWTRSELGGLDENGFIAPELVRYQTFDGKTIPAFYFRPEGPGPFPVVISIHGGPEAQARPNFSAIIQYLVTRSKIAVLVPNVRGSDGYGKTYLALDNGRLREDSVKDIGALIDWVATRGELNDKRVAVMGGSYGGYMVLASLIHFGPKLVAGIDVVGISNFVTFLENTAAYRRDLRRVEYGDESDPAMREFLLSISPTTHVDKIKSALFVAHGANDPRVPLSEADQIAAAVKKNGKDVWKMVAMNEGHGFAKRENRDAYLSLAIMFLQEHLRR